MVRLRTYNGCQYLNKPRWLEKQMTAAHVHGLSRSVSVSYRMERCLYEGMDPTMTTKTVGCMPVNLSRILWRVIVMADDGLAPTYRRFFKMNSHEFAYFNSTIVCSQNPIDANVCVSWGNDSVSKQFLVRFMAVIWLKALRAWAELFRFNSVKSWL